MNGEIYNHQQIRNEERGFAFRTQGDGESILAVTLLGRRCILGSTLGWNMVVRTLGFCSPGPHLVSRSFGRETFGSDADLRWQPVVRF